MLEDEVNQEDTQLNIFIFEPSDDEDDEANYSYPPEDTPLSREVDRLLDILLEM